MDVLDGLGEESALPFLSCNGSPDAVVEAGLQLLLVEVGMEVGQEFWYLVEQIDDFLLGSLDDVLQ